ncbi:PulJ/GspJ family protein [Candidatus Sulfurimonas baltica]|uniref:Prepilin-type N-terminal cleavage/methylation domain-containing protein n=1 Tax=Candidatus Sulfurimonas baltica TaxID=2740404 RepID=A0A7S7LXT7_9BACT|nr:prepilin-type N-terminal cleavage/methylation domain-containing protein [Candidatus Sulfurimonas baltica]QOY52848.1 prepilin-type N-terminal cleavage/methylation domain-containing protein [Candidatus Sulfurimonas baltica]
MRKGFTLIEMLISVTILSIMMVFLYKSYASLNNSNDFLEKELNTIKSQQLRKKIIFLDFSLAINKKINIINQDPHVDVVFMQSSNSFHRKHNPYIAYIVKESKLYRLESLQEFKEYPLNRDSVFSVDYLGEVDSFRVYKSKDNLKEAYLIHVEFKKADEILLKVKVLED